jgi:hypothetical protein
MFLRGFITVSMHKPTSDFRCTHVCFVTNLLTMSTVDPHCTPLIFRMRPVVVATYTLNKIVPVLCFVWTSVWLPFFLVWIFELEFLFAISGLLHLFLIPAYGRVKVGAHLPSSDGRHGFYYYIHCFK